MSRVSDSVPRPTEVRLITKEKMLEIDFDDGTIFTYPAELLRVESPSAEVQGHSPDQKVIVAGRRNIGIVNIEAVGHYALRIRFDDLHDTGIFSWAYLYRLGRDQQEIWSNYLEALDSQGLSRDS